MSLATVVALTLTRLFNSILHDVEFNFVFNYLDGHLVYIETFHEHLEHQEGVLKHRSNAEPSLNPDNITFTKPTISFLDHLVSSQASYMILIQGIREVSPPGTLRVWPIL